MRVQRKYSKILAAGILTCAFTGFGIGIMEMPQEAEAALLPNPPAPMVFIEPVAEPQEQPKLYTEADVGMLARLIYTEARGVESKTEQAAVVWCVLNRLNNPERLEKSIAEVVTAPFQFDYRPWVPAADEFRKLAADVLERWQAEKQATAGSPASHKVASRSEENVGRVLPAEYQFFEGDGQRNHFVSEWKSDEF